ncbi:hypothetical protein D3C72_1517590 [compost metagenome]
MKNYALYLLILCLAVIGCQKDIGENEADLAAKKDKKERYLPVMIVDSSLDYTIPVVDTIHIKYHDNKGNISCVTSSSRKNSVIKFQYNSNNELQRVDYYDNGYYLMTYKHGKLDKCSFYETSGSGSPYFDLLFNVSESDTLTVWERFYGATEFKPRYFFYEDVNNPKALTSTYTYDASWGDYSEIGSNDKNYWAKDIQSKELLFYILGILPTEKNVISIDLDDYVTDMRTNYTEFQYNEANYPIFYKSS